jgi:hypothetical protein
MIGAWGSIPGLKHDSQQYKKGDTDEAFPSKPKIEYQSWPIIAAAAVGCDNTTC